MSEWAIAAAVLLALGVLLVVARLLGRFGVVGEASRKLVHLGMGGATLAFPWLFDSPWPVAALAAAACAALAAVRWWRPLRARLGGVLGGVERASLGEFYFPIAVAAVFALSGGDPLRYGVPIGVLVVADAVAALVGVRYGRLRYTTAEGTKTWEGSAAFALAAFLVVHVPVLLAGHTGRAESLLIAGTLALLVMLIEAASWRGLDNLFVPLMAWLLLDRYLALPLQDLAFRFAAAVGVVAIARLWSARTTLTDAGLFAAAVGGYVVLAVAGWRWLVPLLVLLLCYTRLSPAVASDRERAHDVQAVLAVLGSGLLWLLLAQETGRWDWWPCYAAAFAAQLACIGVARTGEARPEASRAWSVLRHATLGALVVVAPAAAVQWPFNVHAVALAVAAAFLAPALFAAWQRDFGPGASRRGAFWLRQATCCMAASTLPLIAQVSDVR